jgi:hypothetical protein
MSKKNTQNIQVSERDKGLQTNIICLKELQKQIFECLEEARDQDRLQFRVIDAPNSVWMKVFPNHKWDLEEEEYRIIK